MSWVARLQVLPVFSISCEDEAFCRDEGFAKAKLPSSPQRLQGLAMMSLWKAVWSSTGCRIRALWDV